MNLFSVKMRASEENQGNQNHISGAEKIVREEGLHQCVNSLLKRALNHPKGDCDLINIKIEKIDKNNIIYLDPLKVSTVNVNNPKEGHEKIKDILKSLGINNGEEILKSMKDTYSMRGAMLLDYKTMTRLETNKERGIRATNMDFEEMSIDGLIKASDVNMKLYENNHFKEALVLATKVASHPDIIAEICISDDPDYVTGYIASKKFGYIRITKLKDMGDINGGRIFLYNGELGECQNCIDYIENKKVLVKNSIINKGTGLEDKGYE